MAPSENEFDTPAIDAGVSFEIDLLGNVKLN